MGVDDEPQPSSPSSPSRAAAAPSAEAVSSAAGAATMVLKRLHILPMAESDMKLGGRNRMEFLGPKLRRIRTEREVLRTGDLVRHEDLDFTIIKCEPPEGRLGLDTDFFLDGNPVVTFGRIQFSAWGPVEMPSEAVFAECVVPYMKGEYNAYGPPSTQRVRLFYANQVVQVPTKAGDVYIQVEATEPQGLGVVSAETEIFALWDQTPDFDKVHIVPFQDTLPRAYDFDIFQDYLKPYLVSHTHKKFSCNELFMFQGVQFKIVACEPLISARIGKGTTIFCEGVLHPSLRNLLPPELLGQVAQLPPGLQMLLLNTERTTRELEDMLTQRRGLFEETLEQIERFPWPPADVHLTTQDSCMVCLGEFGLADHVARLPCKHVFHSSCVDEWLRRCTDCPICKDNVDRAIRHY